jgi:hypothetical protein
MRAKISSKYVRDSAKLHGAHKGETIIVVGNAPSLAETDLSALDRFVTIGCNRILMHDTFRPTYLVCSDRRPYKEEIDSGRLEKHSDSVKMLFSTTIYDPAIQCHGAPPMEYPKFPWHPWRVGVSSSPFNWTTFDEPLCSFASISGPMIQAAVIMGATRIGIVGIDMQTPPSAKRGSTHFYKNEGLWEGYNKDLKARKPGDPVVRDSSLKRYKEAFHELGTKGIDIYNVSPWDWTRFSREFGTTTMADFLEVCGA